MTTLICLANSRKYHNRCIAGLTPAGRWVRPVSKLPDGSVTWPVRQVDHREPRLLELLEIPLEETGPDFGHQPENRLIRPGQWLSRGSVAAEQILDWCEERDRLLHTVGDRVSEADLAPLELPARRSLQLVRVRDARFYLSRPYDGRQHVKTHFTYAGVAYDIAVTDPLIEDRVWREQPVRPDCMLTVSLGGVYAGFHYKLVAAAIEL